MTDAEEWEERYLRKAMEHAELLERHARTLRAVAERELELFRERLAWQAAAQTAPAAVAFAAQEKA